MPNMHREAEIRRIAHGIALDGRLGKAGNDGTGSGEFRRGRQGRAGKGVDWIDHGRPDHYTSTGAKRWNCRLDPGHDGEHSGTPRYGWMHADDCEKSHDHSKECTCTTTKAGVPIVTLGTK